MQQKQTRNLLISLLVFLGAGALFGGGILMIAPDGSLIGMPVSILRHSPFTDFLIPGVILFVVLGIVPVLLAIALVKQPASKVAERINIFKDMQWTWSFCIYIGVILIGWIQVQMVLLSAVHWLHTLYMFLSILIIITALLPGMRRLYKKDQ